MYRRLDSKIITNKILTTDRFLQTPVYFSNQFLNEYNNTKLLPNLVVYFLKKKKKI